MRILFLSQCYAPEEVSASVLITELAADLAARGHTVTMATCAPNYPYGRVFSGYRNRFYQAEQLDGVRVLRSWTYISPDKAFWRRLLNISTFSLSVFWSALLAGHKPDVLVSYSPPFTLGLSAWLLSRIWGVPWVLQLEDLYPDAAVAAGVLHNRTMIRFFTALERFYYRHATHISLISKTFQQNLSSKGVPAEKMTLIPVWADPDFVRPAAKDNGFRHRFDLDGKFVVMYAGNIGLTSMLEDVLAAAGQLKEEPDIRFVIIGEGVKKAALQAIAHSQELHNVIFLPFQPREDFPEMLAAADVGLVTLNQRSAMSSLPSKVFNIMASARAMIAVAPLDCELTGLVQESGCGMAIPPENPGLLAQAIRQLKQTPHALEQMGQQGRLTLETYYARAECVGMHERMLARLCQAGPAGLPTAGIETG
ncbi:MAG: glycosyltransferase family 4 protein [Chloroflexi bacterium]|nr:glycosyltransferase family 4 protein [Anaerolineaceae bacterium]NMB90974.1 glycosyltransferase family 4 protein [Chloroflexota bacterium]